MSDGRRSRGRVLFWEEGERGGYGFALEMGDARPRETVFVFRKSLRGWPKVRSLPAGAVIEYTREAAKPGMRACARDVVLVEEPKEEGGGKYLPGEIPGTISKEEASKMRGAAKV